MPLVPISEAAMSSFLSGAGGNTATTTTATYGFDHELEFLKSTSASVRASPHSSSSSSSLSSCFTSSSPNSTISESSNSLSPPLSICTRKPRTHRKRPNQTYNEAAALLSTAYPNIFSPKHLAKPPSFKFAKPIDNIASWLNSTIEEELLLPLPLPEKPCEPRLGLVTSSSCTNYSDSSSEKPCRSPIKENEFREGYDFDAESILDEEIEGGIDSIMGNLTAKSSDNGDHNQQQKTSNYCYGIPLGLGFGLLNGGFDFGYGMTRGVKAFRNSAHSGYGGTDERWRFPTVDIGAISPTLEKKKKLPDNKVEVIPPVKEEIPAASSSDCRIKLKLNYDDVLSGWSDRGSPFSDDFLATESSGKDASTRLAQIDLFGENNGGVREASVQRYKEKRRNRLFSKKIRYQVRKLNADQRPRMKGRFVRGLESSAGAQQTLET